MPPYNWQCDPITLIKDFEKRHNNPEGAALLSWAVWTVDCLYYLDDIDRDFDKSGNSIGGHHPDTVNVAHARWATSSAITALDLCAAGLGRAFCSQKGKTYEFDIGDFKKNKKIKLQLPADGQNWIDKILADPKYNDVKNFRDKFIHSRLKRHLYLTTKVPNQRLDLEFDSTRLSVRDLIGVARELATRHVLSFLQVISSL